MAFSAPLPDPADPTADIAKMLVGATWASWNGGPFHRLFKDGDLGAIACGKPRKPKPSKVLVSVDRPINHTCPTCVALDDLAVKDAAGDMVGPGCTDPFLVDGPDPDPIVVPPGVCVCGAAGCNTVDALRLRGLIAARDATIKANRLAAFDAFLAGVPS